MQWHNVFIERWHCVADIRQLFRQLAWCHLLKWDENCFRRTSWTREELDNWTEITVKKVDTDANLSCCWFWCCCCCCCCSCWWCCWSAKLEIQISRLWSSSTIPKSKTINLFLLQENRKQASLTFFYSRQIWTETKLIDYDKHFRLKTESLR